MYIQLYGSSEYDIPVPSVTYAVCKELVAGHGFNSFVLMFYSIVMLF